MRLNEILDPSMYRSGDERNPRSPHYDGREIDPNVEEYPTQFEWYFYDEDNNETVAMIAGSVEVVTMYHDYIPSRRRSSYDDEDGPEASGVSIQKLTIKQVKVGETVMSGKQAAQQFGAAQFEEYKSELVEAAAKGIVDVNKPDITDWQQDTTIVFL